MSRRRKTQKKKPPQTKGKENRVYALTGKWRGCQGLEIVHTRRTKGAEKKLAQGEGEGDGRGHTITRRRRTDLARME